MFYGGSLRPPLNRVFIIRKDGEGKWPFSWSAATRDTLRQLCLLGQILLVVVFPAGFCWAFGSRDGRQPGVPSLSAPARKCRGWRTEPGGRWPQPPALVSFSLLPLQDPKHQQLPALPGYLLTDDFPSPKFEPGECLLPVKPRGPADFSHYCKLLLLGSLHLLLRCNQRCLTD